MNGFLNLQRSNRSAFENHDYNDSNISGTITTIETPFKPVGSVTLPVSYSENGTQISSTVSEIFDRKHIALNALFLYSSSLLLRRSRTFVRERLFEFTTSYRSAFEIHGYNDSNISGTITTTETSFVPKGSVTLPVPYSENRTQIPFTVSEIFDQKHIALNAIFLYSSSLLLLLAVRIHSLGY